MTQNSAAKPSAVVKADGVSKFVKESISEGLAVEKLKKNRQKGVPKAKKKKPKLVTRVPKLGTSCISNSG